MTRYALLIVIPLMLVSGMVAAQNNADPVVIDSVTYQSLRPSAQEPLRHGRTKEQELRAAYGQLEGQSFANEQELQAFLQQYQYRLQESQQFTAVKVEYSLAQKQGEEGSSKAEVRVTVNDGMVFVPLPYATFSTSVGLTLAVIARADNIDGRLFNIGLEGKVIFPMREGSLSWTNPSYVMQVDFERIKAGPTEITIKNLFFDNRLFIADRGDEVFGYQSMELQNEFIVAWPFRYHWVLEGSLVSSGALRSQTLFVDAAWQDYVFDRPAHFLVEPAIAVHYNNAPWIKAAKQGDMARLKVAYRLSQPYFGDKGLDHSAIINAKYGRFWRSTSFFFPSITVEGYYKSGKSEFDLGRFIYGITDNQWRGNGGLFVTSNFMFKIFEWETVMQGQLGPLIGYGLVFEHGRPFIELDQGFTFGLTAGLFLDQLPSVPLYLTVAIDARNRHGVSFAKRIEIDMRAKFDF